MDKNYRNVFLEIGKTPEEINARVEETFQEIFYGKDSFFETTADGTMGYLVDTGNVDTRTEGMGYAIPISFAWDIIKQMIDNDEVSALDASYLGIAGYDVTAAPTYRRVCGRHRETMRRDPENQTSAEEYHRGSMGILEQGRCGHHQGIDPALCRLTPVQRQRGVRRLHQP